MTARTVRNPVGSRPTRGSVQPLLFRPLTHSVRVCVRVGLHAGRVSNIHCCFFGVYWVEQQSWVPDKDLALAATPTRPKPGWAGLFFYLVRRPFFDLIRRPLFSYLVWRPLFFTWFVGRRGSSGVVVAVELRWQRVLVIDCCSAALVEGKPGNDDDDRS